MSAFKPERQHYDGAFCTADTFRHITSDKGAIQHLRHIAYGLKKNAFYAVALHLLPEQGFTTNEVRWQGTRGRLKIETRMKTLEVNRKRRYELLEVQLNINKNGKKEYYVSSYKLRTYTLRQLKTILHVAGVFRITKVYNHDYTMANSIQLTPDSEDVVLVLKRQ